MLQAVELFELLASTTWRTIYRANRNRISFGEDAITSINLNAIASLNDRCVAVEDTRVDEAHKGCDFELWIGSHSRRWRRYAVQAKKITFRGWRYDKLNHEVRGRAQIDVLNDYAAKVRAVPVYLFYNFAPHVMTFNCRRDRNFSQLGCMVVPAPVVASALRMRRSRHFGWMHMQPEAIPWRCLLTCSHTHNQTENKHVPFRWPAADTFMHESLPEDLRAEIEQPQAIDLIEPPPYPVEDESFYPRWRVVVDIGNDREP